MGGKSALRKIKFAKKWLERAEKAYLQGKSEEGFLSLSLAEAEIRTLQEREWERNTGVRRRGLRETVEVLFLAFLLVLSLSSYISLERENFSTPAVVSPPISVNKFSFYKVGLGEKGDYSVIALHVSFKLRGNIGTGMMCKIGVSVPQAFFFVKGGVSRSGVKEVIAHILYLEPRVFAKSERRELLSPEEMLRLVELGKREFKAYIAGGR
ncbi:MAG: hypothetical protein J7M13_08420 [Synergistetes bacterium]|nr:hypothetical protein [Synergistota bacterium]